MVLQYRDYALVPILVLKTYWLVLMSDQTVKPIETISPLCVAVLSVEPIYPLYVAIHFAHWGCRQTCPENVLHVTINGEKQMLPGDVTIPTSHTVKTSSELFHDDQDFYTDGLVIVPKSWYSVLGYMSRIIAERFPNQETHLDVAFEFHTACPRGTWEEDPLCGGYEAECTFFLPAGWVPSQVKLEQRMNIVKGGGCGWL
jgi:hypothetical protein